MTLVRAECILPQKGSARPSTKYPLGACHGSNTAHLFLVFFVLEVYEKCELCVKWFAEGRVEPRPPSCGCLLCPILEVLL